MNSGLIFLIIFIIIFIMFVIYLWIRKISNKLMKVNQYAFLVHRYQFDPNMVAQKQLMFIVAFSNAFIIANAVMVIEFFDVSVFWKILIAFLVIFSLIFIVYGIIGYFITEKK